MKITRGAPLLAALSLSAFYTSAVRAQDSSDFVVKIHVQDSIAHVVDRQSAEQARFAIVSRDGRAALLLMDTTIVAQMTDRGMARMDMKEATDTIKSAAARLFARMAMGALVPLFDHGIAYHLRDLADARYADGRLQLLRANGDEVFHDVQIGKGPLMESFSAADARTFAARAKIARAQLAR